jgi:response regulator of citrate/malate metabolism
LTKKIRRLSPYERAINDVLRNARRPLSTREVAEYGNMSWLTAKKYLERLNRKRKTVHTKKKGKSRLWYLR